MIGLNLPGLSGSIVFVCRIALCMCALHWWIERDVLQLSVAIGSLAITLLPRVLIRDQLLGDMSALLTALLLGAHVVFGMFGALYETSSVYDKFMHALGSWAIAGLLMLAVHRYCVKHRINLPVLLTATIVLGGTLSAGTLWEIFEFAIDQTGLFYAQRGLEDTMLDLLADAVGGFILIAFSLTTNVMGRRYAH